MATAPLPELVLYTRSGCHLCEEVKAVIESVASAHPLRWREVDIDGDPELRERFNEEVPVLFIDGRKAFKYHVTVKGLLARLRLRK